MIFLIFVEKSEKKTFRTSNLLLLRRNSRNIINQNRCRHYFQRDKQISYANKTHLSNVAQRRKHQLE